MKILIVLCAFVLIDWSLVIWVDTILFIETVPLDYIYNDVRWILLYRCIPKEIFNEIFKESCNLEKKYSNEFQKFLLSLQAILKRSWNESAHRLWKIVSILLEMIFSLNITKQRKRSRKFSKFFSHAQISPISIVDFFPQKRKGGTVSRIDNRPFRTSVTRVPFGHPRRWLAFYDSLRFPSRLSACKRHRSDWFTSHEILFLQ